MTLDTGGTKSGAKASLTVRLDLRGHQIKVSTTTTGPRYVGDGMSRVFTFYVDPQRQLFVRERGENGQSFSDGKALASALMKAVFTADLLKA